LFCTDSEGSAALLGVCVHHRMGESVVRQAGKAPQHRQRCLMDLSLLKHLKTSENELIIFGLK